MITFSSTAYHLLEYQCLTRLSKHPESQWTYLTAELLWAIQRTFLPISDLLSSNCSGVCWNFSCSSKRISSYANWYILASIPGCKYLRCSSNCTRTTWVEHTHWEIELLLFWIPVPGSLSFQVIFQVPTLSLSVLFQIKHRLAYWYLSRRLPAYQILPETPCTFVLYFCTSILYFD